MRDRVVRTRVRVVQHDLFSSCSLPSPCSLAPPPFISFSSLTLSAPAGLRAFLLLYLPLGL
jgi:hypothetical protein